MKYLEGPETFGLIAGSAAVLKDEKFLYAYGAVESSTHEIYVLRGDGIYITYNVNSFDFDELIENQNLYFPRFILIKITENKTE